MRAGDELPDRGLEKGLHAAFSKAPSGDAMAAGARVGRYRVQRLIATGGMATVYEAVQDHPRRVVALKMLKPGRLTPAVLRRFELEAEILGRLEHPLIAQVFDARRTEDGTPYLVMEHVNGARDLLSSAQAAGWPLKHRVKVLADICDAVHHGHMHGVIHRDLKPENLLVDTEGRPKVIDYGIARITNAELRDTIASTRSGEVLGTLWYMSPEQFGTDPDAIDVRTDVYSLGVVACELFGGELPYPVRRATLFEAADVIRNTEPCVDVALPADLRAIIVKCLEKDPAQRYDNVASLGRDLRRFLADEPVEARSLTTWYILRKTLARHKAKTAVAALFLVTVVVAAALLLLMYREAENRAEELRRTNYYSSVALAQHAFEVSDMAGQREFMERCPEDLRGWEWYWLASMRDTSVGTLDAKAGALSGLVLSPDGGQIATRNNRELVVYDTATRALLWRRPVAAPRMTFSPDTKTLVVVRRGAIEEYDALTGHLRGSRALPGVQPSTVRFSPDGKFLVIGGRSGVVTIEGGAALRRIKAHSSVVRHIRFKDDSTFATSSTNGLVRLWNVATGERISEIRAHTGLIGALAVQGDLVLTGGNDGLVRLWNAADGALVWEARQLGVADAVFGPDWVAVAGVAGLAIRSRVTGSRIHLLHGHARGVTRVALDPTNSSRLYSTARDSGIKIWELPRSAPSGSLPGHRSIVRDVAISPDGRTLATASLDRTVRLWDIETYESQVLRIEGSYSQALAYSPDGARIYIGREDGALEILDLASGARRTVGAGEAVVRIATNGGHVAVARDGGATLHDAKTGAQLRVFEGAAGEVRDVLFLRDGATVALGSRAGQLGLWDVATGKLRRMLREGDQIWSLALSPDGGRLMVGGKSGEDGLIEIWSLRESRVLHTRAPGSGAVSACAFLGDGERVFVASQQGVVKVLEPTLRRRTLTLRPSGGLARLALHPDGSCLAVVGNGGLHVWKVRR